MDVARIGQMASNLLTNAIVHADPEQPIRLETTLEGAELKLSVTNAGPAIPEAATERLFQPFVRGEIAPTSAVSAWVCTSRRKSRERMADGSACRLRT